MFECVSSVNSVSGVLPIYIVFSIFLNDLFFVLNKLNQGYIVLLFITIAPNDNNRQSLPIRIVVINQIVHLNTVNCIVRARTIMPLKSRYLPGFLKQGTAVQIAQIWKWNQNI